MSQLALFAAEPRVASAAPAQATLGLAARLPSALRLGASTWSYPGWAGQVYAQGYSAIDLAREGLRAYAQHPLYRCVGVDRSFYAPPEVEAFRVYAAQVPHDFRFVVKAHQACTMAILGGTLNPRFLDPAHARDAVVEPTREGLGDKLAVLLFQFPPQDLPRLGGVDRFIDRLYRFLRALPAGVRYAVEVRNPALLTERFAQALRHSGALPTVAGWNGLPPPGEQAQAIRALEHDTLFVRWMLHGGYLHHEAEKRYHPYDQLVDPDPIVRGEMAALASQALAAGKQVVMVVGNKAEGSAPRSIEALAQALT